MTTNKHDAQITNSSQFKQLSRRIKKGGRDGQCIRRIRIDAGDVRDRDYYAFRVACKGGHAAILEAFARPPFSLGHADASFGENCALRAATEYEFCGDMSHGQREVKRILTSPPYSLGADDIREAKMVSFYDKGLSPPPPEYRTQYRDDPRRT